MSRNVIMERRRESVKLVVAWATSRLERRLKSVRAEWPGLQHNPGSTSLFVSSLICVLLSFLSKNTKAMTAY